MLSFAVVQYKNGDAQSASGILVKKNELQGVVQWFGGLMFEQGKTTEENLTELETIGNMNFNTFDQSKYANFLVQKT